MSDSKDLKSKLGNINVMDMLKKIIPAKPSAPLTLTAKTPKQICIAIDDQLSQIHFYTVSDGDKGSLRCESKAFRSTPFRKEFLDEFQKIVTEYAQGQGNAGEASVSLVVPDRAVAMDTISIPTLSKKKNNETVNISISGLYRNRNNLKILSCIATQNKQHTTYAVSVMKNELLENLKQACSLGGMFPQSVTFAANTASLGAQFINAKLKDSSFILADLKEEYTRISFVASGRTTGFYTLPFGWNILATTKTVSEDMLFDHDLAELTVLNAKEKARAKQLTIMRNEESLEEDFDEEAENDPTQMAAVAPSEIASIKALPKKQPRKLPKFMLRPTPQNDEESTYENFRIFMKWILNLIQQNDKLIFQGRPEAVYMNMPKDYGFLTDMANAEKEENKIEFRMLDVHEKAAVLENLELLGGFYSMNANRFNTF